MKIKTILLLLFIIVADIFAQSSSSISGIVIDNKTDEPLAGVNVFLSGTFIGTMTDSNGEFEIEKVPVGEQMLVISIVGYEKFTRNFSFKNGDDSKNIEVRLDPKTYELDEVNVFTTDPDEWKNYFEIFRREFIGNREYGDDCKILNPYSINFSYEKKNDILHAYSDSLLIIENWALGYKLNLVLLTFKWYCITDKIKGTLENEYFFSPLEPKDEKQKAEWIENRRKTYNLSPRCFYQNIIADPFIDLKKYSVSQMDFQGYKRKKEIKQITSEFNEKEKLYLVPLKTSLFIMLIYGYHRYESILKFPNNELLLRPNGIPLNIPDNVVMSGYWARYRISDVLPSDYDPNKDGDEQ